MSFLRSKRLIPEKKHCRAALRALALLSAIPVDTLRSNPGSTNHPSGLGGFLGDNWDSERDEDWYRIDLTQGYVYTVELWTDETYPVRREARQLKIIGFYDNSGAEISGASSPPSGKSVTATYRSESTGRYHIAVGSEGSDDSGVYSIRVIAIQQEETAEQSQDTTTIDPTGQAPRSLAEKWRLQPGKRLYLGKTCITGAENVGRAK